MKKKNIIYGNKGTREFLLGMIKELYQTKLMI